LAASKEVDHRPSARLFLTIRVHTAESPVLAHRFGPFEFDPASGRLFRGSKRVPLSDPQSAMLLQLIQKAGEVVTKEALAEAGWRSVSVTENSVAQSIMRLRKVLSSARNGQVYIETVPSLGYRFVAPVERTERLSANPPPGAELAPYRAFLRGRADLHTLNRDAIRRARTAFEEALRSDPDYVPARVGLANACALTFEATRLDATCDRDALRQAIRHARHATTLAPSSGDAWSTLAFALCLEGQTEESAAAAHKAIALEPDDWLHSLRLAYVSWGEPRIRAARTVLGLCPGLALAHWLIATVLVARGAFEAALAVLNDGCTAQDIQPTTVGSFPAVGLHLLRGLVFGAQGRLDEAAHEFTRELQCVGGDSGRQPGEHGQLYARECAANTWYALGAIRLRARRRDEAEAAFANALTIAPGHAFAAAALGRPIRTFDEADFRWLDAALARAIGLARAGRHGEAAQAYQDAVVKASLPSAGWILPVEPLIDSSSRPDVWVHALAIVRQQAL
jgi:DNA-binding winged helix-turn-helix (wHTH) protein/tetratricopeptide (TPR) repeat protein